MEQANKTSILLVAGDASGDINTGRLAAMLRQRHPDWALHAVGGEHLGNEAAASPGGSWIGDTTDLSGVGIYSSVTMFPQSLAIGLKVKRFIREHRIDAAVLCDWGAFNCRLLVILKKLGIPVLYYFPPGSWRRTGGGGMGIARSVDRIATPFEWSAQRLTDAGGNAEWVGHPMLEIQYNAERKKALRREFGVADGEKLVALLPGSRMAEINCLAPRLAETAEILRKRGGMQFVVAASGRRVKSVKAHFPDWVKIVPDRAADVLFASDAAVVKSGTATLEAAVIGAPQVVVYDFPWIGRIEWVFLWMWKKNIPFIAMPNVILQRLAVQELLGMHCKPQAIAQAVTGLLEDDAIRARMARDYEEIRQRLGAGLPHSATERTAQILEELLSAQPPA